MAGDQETLARSTLEVIRHFNDAFNRHDVEAIMAAMTEDCVFENTVPPRMVNAIPGRRPFGPIGTASSPHAVFETEEMFACGDRGVVRWVYRWDEPEGRSGHVRGVDIFRVREGKVAEKFSDVKG